jgi:type IV secretory pathway VirB10-like protein
VADPQPVVPQVPKKPLQMNKWLVGATALFAVGYLAISLIHLPGPGANEKPAAQPFTPPASQTDVEAFNRARKQKFDDIAKKRDLLAKEIKESGIGNEAALIEIVNHLPTCNKAERDQLNGQNFVAVNQQTRQIVQFACETDDSWHPLPAAAGTVEPPTPQQQRSIEAQRNQGGTGEGLSPKDRAAQALDAALKSSSVVDFTAAAQTAEPAKVASSQPAFSFDPRTIDPRMAPMAEHATPETESHEVKNHYDWATYTGPLYWVFEGDIIEGILTNRLAGEYTGPVSVMVTTNLYSHDRQHILMPQGTRILGEASKVSISGQRRLATTFNNAFMPDGYPVAFPKLAGLDQQGAAGLTGRVDTHWPKVIATAALVGAIGGLSQIGASGTSLGGIDAIRLGAGQQTGQEAMQILNRALNILPTVTVYEGTRVRIWVQKNFQLPAYESHTVSPTL